MIGEMTSKQIDQLLSAEMIGRIGCYADGKVYVVPVTYAYSNGCIYAHSSEGSKIRMMRGNPEVCFEVEHVENMSNWQSVITHGTFEELIGEEASRAMEMLMERFLPFLGSTSETMPAPHRPGPGSAAHSGNHQAVVYRICLRERSGRYETR
ncbi:MAG: pyridoxamine 5'-phosphate oxidase family protein [Nitrolancea sp.]